jgi:S1-C subfamily serine protease
VRQSQTGESTERRSKRLAFVVFRGVEVAAVAALVAGYFALERRESEFNLRQSELDARAAAASARIEAVRHAADSEIESLKTSLAVIGDSARSREERLRQDLADATAQAKVQERRLSQITGIQEERLTRSEVAIGQRIEQLAADLAVEKSARAQAADRFRVVQQSSDDSVFLLHCVFTYETKEFDDDWKEHQATTWGTAFAISDDGLLVTNKHLVMPWKFDAELAALTAMGEVRVREDSVKLAVWPVGASCLDAAKKANTKTGYSTDRRTLALITTAEDRLAEKSVEMAGKPVKYQMHALDNHDLAMLRVEDVTKGLPLASGDQERGMKKLDPVMAIGFPRGVGGLESTVAMPSVTLGSVRKIEDTIHISAPIVAGNSGGPVFDEDGRVVGVATRIYCETLGICIKAEHARKLVDRARTALALPITANVPSR